MTPSGDYSHAHVAVIHSQRRQDRFIVKDLKMGTGRLPPLRAIQIVCVSVFAGWATPVANASTIQSVPVVLRSTSDPILFDFTADAGVLAARPTITGLSVLWTVDPGETARQPRVIAGLAIPTFLLGDRLHSALDAVLPSPGSGPVTAVSTFSDEAGLPIGPTVIDEFFHDDNNSVGAEFFTSGSDAANLDGFFASGGSLEVRLQLTTDSVAPPPVTGPGGGSVPEPFSLAVWGAAGSCWLLRRRRLG